MANRTTPVAVITGGARGIGFSTAEVLGRDGYALVLADLDADAGAEAVVAPMINTGQDASRLGRSAKYPPLGFRSWGPQRALQAHDLDRDDYLAQANRFCLAWAMVETATAVAQEAIAKVEAGAERVSLEPMNPFERKVVHDAVAAAGLSSDSEGTEPNRYVVVTQAL